MCEDLRGSSVAGKAPCLPKEPALRPPSPFLSRLARTNFCMPELALGRMVKKETFLYPSMEVFSKETKRLGEVFLGYCCSHTVKSSSLPCYKTPLIEHRPAICCFNFFVPSVSLSLAIFVNISSSSRLDCPRDATEKGHRLIIFTGRRNVYLGQDNRELLPFYAVTDEFFNQKGGRERGKKGRGKDREVEGEREGERGRKGERGEGEKERGVGWGQWRA